MAAGWRGKAAALAWNLHCSPDSCLLSTPPSTAPANSNPTHHNILLKLRSQRGPLAVAAGLFLPVRAGSRSSNWTQPVLVQSSPVHIAGLGLAVFIVGLCSSQHPLKDMFTLPSIAPETRASSRNTAIRDVLITFAGRNDAAARMFLCRMQIAGCQKSTGVQDAL